MYNRQQLKNSCEQFQGHGQTKYFAVSQKFSAFLIEETKYWGKYLQFL